jgi:F-type H+-transporting ATPase subunit delta
MPLIESEPDALAKVYARALFEAAETDGVGAEPVLGELEDILEMARNNREFSELLASRLIDTGKRDDSLVRIFDQKISPTVMKFLRLLNRKSRLAHLAPIVGALDAMVQDRFGRIEVDVFTAAPVGQGDLDSIKASLGGSLGKDVILHPYTDASMLGGIKLRIGDQLIDASVRAGLRSLRDRLLDQGANVRSRADNIIE